MGLAVLLTRLLKVERILGCSWRASGAKC
jgi:hypothetical protein